MLKNIFVMLAFLALLLVACGNIEDEQAMDSFAQCLTESGMTMYGAYWCPHCNNMKEKFGSSFQHVDYVECDPRGEDSQSGLCIDKNIEGYPTWEFSDGSRLTGEQPLERLGAKTNCSLQNG